MKIVDKQVASLCLLLFCCCSAQKRLPATRRYQESDTLSLHRLDSFELKRSWNLTGHATVRYEQFTFSKPNSSGKQHVETFSRITAGIDREITATDSLRQQTEQFVNKRNNRTLNEEFKSPKADKRFGIICFIIITGIILWIKRKFLRQKVRSPE